jgi:hypothetical protein
MFGPSAVRALMSNLGKIVVACQYLFRSAKVMNDMRPRESGAGRRSRAGNDYLCPGEENGIPATISDSWTLG